MNKIQISKIVDEDIKKIKIKYLEENLQNFKKEYLISDTEFFKILDENNEQEHSKIYKILLKKHKRIFDVLNSDEIIVIFQEKDVEFLCEILQDNLIKCNSEDFRTYLWVRFNSTQILEFANFGPINHNCPAYTFDEFLNLINK